MNNMSFNIKRVREQKGYSQDFMAAKLNISQASYARLESRKTTLTIDRLQEIANILDTDIAAFFDSPKLTIQTQTNNEGAYGNGYIENLHIENKETLQKLIQILENENQHLKTEIEFLRSSLIAASGKV
ncbi:MAG: helix-turn-helix transcriptional regulator [Bacteroidales bacterium]|nr:helix-turn-helix transcriptional regulator [Bacteroidales bacterium]